MNEYMNDYPLEISRGLSLTRFIFGREMRCRNPDEWNRPFLESLAFDGYEKSRCYISLFTGHRFAEAFSGLKLVNHIPRKIWSPKLTF